MRSAKQPICHATAALDTVAPGWALAKRKSDVLIEEVRMCPRPGHAVDRSSCVRGRGPQATASIARTTPAQAKRSYPSGEEAPGPAVLSDHAGPRVVSTARSWQSI